MQRATPIDWAETSTPNIEKTDKTAHAYIQDKQTEKNFAKDIVQIKTRVQANSKQKYEQNTLWKNLCTDLNKCSAE